MPALNPSNQILSKQYNEIKCTYKLHSPILYIVCDFANNWMSVKFVVVDDRFDATINVSVSNTIVTSDFLWEWRAKRIFEIEMGHLNVVAMILGQ